MSYYVIDEDEEGEGGAPVGGTARVSAECDRGQDEREARVMAERYGKDGGRERNAAFGKGRYRDDDDLEIPLYPPQNGEGQHEQGHGYSFFPPSLNDNLSLDFARNKKGWKGIVISCVLIGFLIIALSIALAKSNISLDSLKGTNDAKEKTGAPGFDNYYGSIEEKEDSLGQLIGSGADGRNLTGEHPIYSLLDQATVQLQNRTDLAKQLGDLEFSRQYYQSRYLRSPPKEFDRWHDFAQKFKSEVVDSIQTFDSMMNQLLPFRAVHPSVLRERIWNSVDAGVVIFTIYDRKLAVWTSSNERYEGSDPVVAQVGDMLSRLIDEIGDIEFPLNIFDESRSTIAYETEQLYVKSALAKEFLIPKGSKDTKPTWTVDTLPEKKSRYYVSADPSPVKRPDPLVDPVAYMAAEQSATEVTGWQLMSESCPPDSPARLTPRNPYAGHTMSSSLTSNGIGWQGQVRNTSSTAVGGFLNGIEGMLDVCIQPGLQGLAGFAIRPNHLRVLRDQVYPIFSTTRAAGFSDILVPGAHHWTPSVKAQKKSPSWKSRKDRLYWRGTTSGSLVKGYEWHGSHRQRLIARVHRSRGGPDRETVLVEQPISNKNHGSTPHLGTVTLSAFDLDSGLTDCLLTDVSHCEAQACDDMRNSSLLVFGTSIPDEDGKQRYVLDLDDDGPSKDFIPFLTTGAMVLKSTILEEFYTKSLIPWYHFVPLEARYLELYNILTWFRGFSGPTFEPSSSLEKGLTESEIRALEASLSTAGSGPKPPFLEDWINKRLATQAVEHSDRARVIGEQGRLFAKEQLRRDDCLIYWYRLLVEWKAILQIDGEGGRACQFGGCLSANQPSMFESRPWKGTKEGQ